MGSKTSNRQLAPKVLFLFIMSMSSNPVSSITCKEALGYAAPCKKYAVDAAPFPPSPECCSGVHFLAQVMVYDNDGRKVLCKCYQDIPPSVGVKSELTQKIIRDCEPYLYFPTDPGVDCNR
ncbi:hypothetical protein BT93_B1009 [Corymbia citriodora subsp. variegata]|nr:hypothetical protein BT93_B1009 [Corymbia citriodora subsp. variegata]